MSGQPAGGRLGLVAAVSAVLSGCAPSAGGGADSVGAAAAPAGQPAPAAVAESATVAPRAPVAPRVTSGASPAAATRTSGDSVRGIVAVVGSDPMSQVVVRPADGRPSLTVVGDGAAGLRSVSGAEVVVRGTIGAPREIRATSFTVRTVDGVAAADGILERAGDAYALRLPDGTRRPVVRPSPALVAYLGARVWVTGPADVEPQAFGLIER